MLALAAAATLGAAIAQADVVGGANVRVTFRAWLTPRYLPRTEPAPVTLHLEGSLETRDGKEPPALRRVTVAVNRYGRVTTEGLPTCPRGALVATTTIQALTACRAALVGDGIFTAHIAIPEQAPFPSRGRVLAFNAVQRGHRVILAQIFGRDPVPTSQVLTLSFQRQRKGRFGTTLALTMPRVGDDWGHVTGFELNLHRRYRYRGRVRSVISASCPAPNGFDSAVFAAARGIYLLADGREISRVFTGSCWVRH
jgi:hypothetical protein